MPVLKNGGRRCAVRPTGGPEPRSRARPADRPPEPRTADLYWAGREYAAVRGRLRVGRRSPTWRAVAAACGAAPDAVRTAVTFAAAVDRIGRNCGRAAKALLLSDHPRLLAQVVMRISRTHPDRQRYALAQARAGRNPFAPPPAGVPPPYDTHGPAEVLGRLARNAGAVHQVADGLRDTPPALWPAAARLRAMVEQAAGIRRHVRLMRRLVAGVPAAPSARPPRTKRSDRGGRRECKPSDPARAPTAVAAAAGVTAKNARELARALATTPPAAAQKQALLDRLRELDAAAGRLLAVVRARDHDTATGPSGVPGTYVVFLRLPRAAAGVRIGRLGTFDFPAGVYAYLGSAFGPGGVRGRTHRHLTRRSARPRWNVDHLKPLCVPLAVWWTHDRAKVEFAWARLLGSLPGASFPAPAFGAADNRAAEAHLFRFARLPSAAGFRRRVREAMPHHASVHAKTVRHWSGHGWPV